MPASSNHGRKKTLLRDAWEPVEYTGVVESDVDKDDGQERLVIRCEAVAAEHGTDACILDDGRTPFARIGDRVAFGIVVPDDSIPIAVNVCRLPKKRKRVDADAAVWEKAITTTDDFDYLSASAGGKRKQKEEEKVVEQPSFDQQKFTGIIKGQSQNSGNYFIQNDFAWQRWSRDVTLRYAEIPDGLEVGDAVTFRMTPPHFVDGPPSAWKVKKVVGDQATEIQEKAREERLAQKGASGKGKGGGKEKSSFSRRSKGPSISMTGIVKKKSMITGRHFVFCQDISDVCGQDAQIPPDEIPEGVELKCGDRISFEVEEPDETKLACPLVFNVRLLGGRQGASLSNAVAGDDGEDDNELDEVIEQDVDDDDQAHEEPIVDQGEDNELFDEDPGIGVGEEGVDEDAPTLENSDVGDPDTIEEWTAAQRRLFPGLPKLPHGWIRMRSKSTGLVYYYNTDTGESSPTPPASRPSGDPQTIDEWVAAQARLFPGLSKLPAGWIRMRSKSTGHTYYYNVNTGASTPNEPIR